MTSRKIHFLSLFLWLPLVLTGCGSYSNSFDCPIGKGLHCASLSAVNDKIDRKELDISFPESSSFSSDSNFWDGFSSCKDCENKTSSFSAPKVYWKVRS